MMRSSSKKNVTVVKNRPPVKGKPSLVRHRPDRFLTIGVILLCCIGLFCLASASSVVAYTSYGDA